MRTNSNQETTKNFHFGSSQGGNLRRDMLIIPLLHKNQRQTKGTPKGAPKGTEVSLSGYYEPSADDMDDDMFAGGMEGEDDEDDEDEEEDMKAVLAKKGGDDSDDDEDEGDSDDAKQKPTKV